MRLILVGVLGAAVAWAETPVVGFSHNPPMVHREPDGRPGGFLAEVIEAAAAREGVRFEWRFSPNMSDEVDIWPGGVDTPERRKRFYVTKPWWSSGLLLVSRQEFATLDATRERVVRATADLISETAERLPGATLEAAPTHMDAIVSVCSGSADAMVTDRILLDRLLLRRPPECHGLPLSVLTVPEATLDLHILAQPKWKATADALTRGIDSIARDGTIARIALRHPAGSGGSAAYLTSILEANQRNATLWSTLWVLCAALALFGLWLSWLLRQNKARRHTESELRRANAELKETNSDLEQFNYAASHDLSEPLRNMSLYSELLQRRYGPKLDATGMQYVTVIRDGALRLEQLLDGLRRYALLSKTVGTQDADAQKVFSEAVANLQPIIQESHAIVTADELPTVPLEPAWLMQVLQNLISNAIKYRGHEPPRVHVGVERAHGYFRLSVRDNGVGIKPEYQERVFAVFKRLHGREVPGTGIGLAICRKIVERHGGRIWVESAGPGAGSTFYFTIPERESEHDSGFRRARRRISAVRARDQITS